MANRLDEIDKRILYYLTEDARNTSAPMIAEEVNVSAGTIRNRIDRLEDRGIIEGYHAAIDYERADGSLMNLLVCDTDAPDREKLAKQVLRIPGVVNVRELMTGRGNLHVTVVGADTSDLTHIGRALSELGVDIVDEGLLQQEYVTPYHPFGPEEGLAEQSMADFMSLAGDAEVVSLTVAADAPVAGRTLREANEDGLIGADVLVVAIERENAILTPRGDTTIRPDDLATVFSRDGVSDDLLSLFTDESGDR
jgi:Lrp/AsnC family leucine-responsive transcriptional regulator